MPQQTDFNKMAKFIKPKLNVYWQINHFSAHIDIQCWMPLFASTETGNILIPTSHRGPGSNHSPRISGQLTSTSQTFMMLCFLPVHCSFCVASHWGWTSWPASQGEQAKTWNAIQHVSLSWLWLITFTPVPWAHTLGHTAIQCCIMWVAHGHGKHKKPLKRVIFTRIHQNSFRMSYLNLAAEITYKQAADVVPDGGKILWHIERLLLPKIHSLLSRIQPFH